MEIKRVKSADGTAIAFETAGEGSKGSPLILVGGAFCDRTARSSLARALEAFLGE